MPSTQHNKVESHYPLANTTAPRGWAKVFVGDACLGIQPGFASGQHNSTGEGVPHLRPMNISREGRLDFSDVRYVADKDGPRLKQGDVLFNNTNSNELIGKTCWIDTDRELAFSNHMTRLRLGDGMSPSFVASQLHFLWMTGYLRYRCTSHVNQASISSKTLAQTIPLFVPPSREQERIVLKLDALLSRVAAGEAAARRALDRLKRYRAAVLHAAVNGELTRDWRKKHSPLNPQPSTESGAQLLKRLLQERRARWEAAELKRLHATGKPPKDDKWKKRYPDPIAPKSSDIRDVPRSWAWASVEQLNPGDRASAYGVLQPGPNIPRGVLLVRVGDINDGQISMAGMKRIAPRIAAMYERTKLQGGELLITLVGAIGRTAVVPDALIGANTARAVGVVPLTPSINADWVELWFRSPAKLNEMVGKAHEVARKTLNLEDVRSAAVPVPPLAEQFEAVREVHRRLASADRLATTLNRQLDHAQATRQSLLREAFAGKLVTQNSEDEPASALLERIRLAREDEAKKPKAKRMPKPKLKSVENLEQLEGLIHDLGKAASPERVLLAARLGEGVDDVEKFFDLLRAGRDKGSLVVPVGKGTAIRRVQHAN